MSSNYLHSVQPENRPVGVVFVDLDEDMLHLGWDATSSSSAGGVSAVRPRRMPDLPSDAMKLKVELEEAADHLYLVPSCGIKGRITTGDDPTVLDNATREPYSQMTRVSKHGTADANNNNNNNQDRHFVLSNAERAFVNHEPTSTWNLLSTQQHFIRQSSSSVSSITTIEESSRQRSLQRTSRTVQAHTDRLLAFAGQTYATPFQRSSFVVTEELKLRLASELYAMDDRGFTKTDAATQNGKEAPVHKKRSPNTIRYAFLRFFASILIRYKNFDITHGGEPTFQRQAFLNDLHLSAKCKKYIGGWLGTQMFERFLLDRRRSRVPDAVLFFDEYIIAKRNGDAKFWKGGAKEPTPFLADTRWKIKQVIVPASPSTWGLAIAYGINTVYKYDNFPKLKEQEFVSSGDQSWRNHLLCRGDMFSWSTSACWPATTEKVLW